MNRGQRRASTRKSRNDASDPGAATPTSFYELGLRHLQADRTLKAQACCQRALELDPDHADSLHLMGLLCLGTKEYQFAVEWLVRAVRQDPRPDYLSSLGTALHRQARYEEAIKTFDKAVQLKPEDAGLWQDFGNVLADAKRTTDAVLVLQHTLKLDPRNWEAADRCGMLLHGMGRLEEALTCFSQCNELRADQGQTLYRRGHTLLDLGRYDAALVDLKRAHALVPGDAEICNSLGFVLQTLARYSEALDAFDKALKLHAHHTEALKGKAFSLAQLDRYEEALALIEQVRIVQPTYAPALVNKGIWLGELHRFDEALVAFDEARALDPGNADTEWNLSFLHLLIGNFEAGWVEREARWKATARLSTSYPDFAKPRWAGKEPVEGKTVLIYAEEGLGDAIQFARYIPMVAALGAKIILVVGEAVRALLSNLPGVSECLAKPMQKQPPFDYHCALSSLPLVFKTRLDTIPGANFLTLPPADRVQAWEDRLGPHEKLRVGLVWSGHSGHKNDRNRSIALKDLGRVLEADASFFSLQKEPRPEDKSVLIEKRQVVDLNEYLTDFVETAALVSCLDLVITVDTSVAHLAGALGRSTWILLPYTPDFRWLLDRDDSPWYPTVRLFRQKVARDYASVIERVGAELRARIAVWSPTR